ncbi:unnamed protein product, partial [Gulo gulo]
MCPVDKIRLLFDSLLLTLVPFSETNYVWKWRCMCLQGKAEDPFALSDSPSLNARSPSKLLLRSNSADSRRLQKILT